MKAIRKPVIVAGLLAALAVPASAFVIPMIPDVCSFGVCVQFTQSTALAHIESLYQQATMLSNEAKNLASIGTVARQAISQSIGGMLGSANASPQTAGDVAATQVIQQAPNAASAIARADSIAQAANGAQQQAQVGNLYLSTIADESVKTNALAAEEQAQQKSTDAAKADMLNKLFSGTSSSEDPF